VSGRGTFTVVATGKTFDAREELKSWAFSWNAENKSWKATGVEKHVVDYLQRMCADEYFWRGVVLDVTEEKLSEMDKILGVNGEKV
jgi:hypothetical protein